MPNKTDFQALEAVIREIDPQTVVHPNMPPGVYFQEAEDLHVWARPDLQKLVAAGFNPAVHESIPQRTGAARYTQSGWNANRFTQEEAQAEFRKVAPEAYELVGVILHQMRFAYRRHEDVLGRVRAIAEGSGDADMIQDLSDISVLGKRNPEPLQAINFDMSLLEKAAQKSSDLASLLGVARGERAVDSEAKMLRDRAYTLLKEAVDELREYGRFVFWRDEERRRGYSSEYMRRMRRRRPASPPTEAEMAEASDAL